MPTNAYNPSRDNQGRVPASISRCLSHSPITKLLPRSQTARGEGVSLLSACGVEGFCEALIEGYTWSDIANHINCRVTTIRREWYSKLPAQDKHLIHWAETQFAKQLAQQVLIRMFESMDDDYLKGSHSGGMEHIALRLQQAQTLNKETQTLERIGNMALKWLSSNNYDSSNEAQEPTDYQQTTIIIISETARAMACM